MLQKQEEAETLSEATTDKARAGNRSQELRRQALESAGTETIAGLEQVFEAKVGAIRVYEQRLQSMTDPYAKRTLQGMIANERKELLNLAELIDFVEQSPDMGTLARARRQLSHQVKVRTGKPPAFWLGAAVLGAVMIPSVRESIRPTLVKVMQSFMELSEQAQGLFSGVREDFEDLMSEAQFERFKESIDEAVDETAVPTPEPPVNG
jgi:hypothetical protein